MAPRPLLSPLVLSLSWAALPLATALSGCQGCTGGVAPVGSGAGSASPSGSSNTLGFPVSPLEVASVVNRSGAAPYAGPKATLKGRVRIDGDEPPARLVKPRATRCTAVTDTYGKLFRKGADGALADALVAVTGYSGFVPAATEAVTVPIQGCAAKRRLEVLTFGQRLDVANLDPVESYMPYLDGAPTRASLVAVPRGSPIRLYPPKPGRYVLKEFMGHDYLQAEVLVLAYSTHDVTELDGQYEIGGIPVGKVRVSTLLPATGSTKEQDLELKEGENQLDIVLTYRAPGAASASAGASAGASASASASAPSSGAPSGAVVASAVPSSSPSAKAPRR